MQEKKVVIIGAGFAGLTTAALLAQKGFKVTVLEKNHEPGGRAITYKEKGFVFDMGPSWYLMPEAFERYFQFFNKQPGDYYDLVQLDTSYRVFYGKDDYVDVAGKLKNNTALFDHFEKNGFAKAQKYLDLAAYQYKVAVKTFLYRDYKKISEFLNGKLILEGIKLKIFQSVDKLVSRFFTSDKIKKIMEYTMVFIGGSPKQTPAFYSLMSHIDLNLGVWYPLGGICKVAEALFQLGEEQGVEFKFNHAVNKIIVDKSQAQSVETQQGSFPADIIIANADYVHTEQDLLDKQYRSYTPGYWKSKVISPSAFIIYMGLNKKLKNIRHHNLYFHDKWDEHFDTIFKHKSWPDKFSYYVSAPSITDNTIAPKDCENLFFLIPVAAGLNDTNEMREIMYNKVLDHFEELIGQKIRENIIVNKIFSQRDFIGSYNSYQGSAFSLAHTLMQTAVFRPARKSKKVKNLYFTGQYTHPGVGIPMAFICGELTAKGVIAEHGA